MSQKHLKLSDINPSSPGLLLVFRDKITFLSSSFVNGLSKVKFAFSSTGIFSDLFSFVFVEKLMKNVRKSYLL